MDSKFKNQICPFLFMADVQFWLHSYVKFLNIMSTSLCSLFSSVLDNLTTTPGNCGFIGYKQWTQTS